MRHCVLELHDVFVELHPKLLGVRLPHGVRAKFAGELMLIVDAVKNSRDMIPAQGTVRSDLQFEEKGVWVESTELP